MNHLDVSGLVRQAQQGGSALDGICEWVRTGIQFNASHGISVTSVTESAVKTLLPFIPNNTNHVGTMHACAMLAAGELASGLRLLLDLDAREHMLVLSGLHGKYLLPGKDILEATCDITSEWVSQNVLAPLSEKGKVNVSLESILRNRENEMICIVTANWYLRRLQTK